MKCTQPGCTGSIVDGYCDVCGSPGATSGTSALLGRRGPSGRGLGARSAQRAGGCRQPGCTGTIVDGYCDVCGTPGDATPAPAGVPPVVDPHLGRPGRGADRRRSPP